MLRALVTPLSDDAHRLVQKRERVGVCVISLATLLHENTSPRSRVARQSPPSAVAPTGHVTDAQAHAVGLTVYATGVRSKLKAECAECETPRGVEHSEVGHAADSVHLRSEVSAAHQAPGPGACSLGGSQAWYVQ